MSISHCKTCILVLSLCLVALSFLPDLGGVCGEELMDMACEGDLCYGLPYPSSTLSSYESRQSFNGIHSQERDDVEYECTFSSTNDDHDEKKALKDIHDSLYGGSTLQWGGFLDGNSSYCCAPEILCTTTPDNINHVSELNVYAPGSLGVEMNLSPSISRLQYLVQLKFAVTDLASFPDSIGELPRLSTVIARFCQLNGFPESFGNLSSLTYLEFPVSPPVKGNFVIPASFVNLDRLTSLLIDSPVFLSDDQLCLFSSLSIEYLELQGMSRNGISKDISDCLAALKPTLRDLTILRLDSEKLPDWFGDLALTRFRLSNAPKVTTSPHLPETLTSIVLHFVEFNDFSFLSSLVNLQSILIHAKTLHAVDEIFEPMTQLQNLTLECPLQHINSLPRLTNLRNVDLSATLASLPDDIGDLTQLETLILTGRGIFSSIPDSFCRLENLRVLDLVMVLQLFDHLPNCIGDLSSLEILSIPNTPMKTLPDSMANLQKLRIYNFGTTPMLELPKGLCSWTHLEKFTQGCDYTAPVFNISSDCKNLANLQQFIMVGCKINFADDAFQGAENIWNVEIIEGKIFNFPRTTHCHKLSFLKLRAELEELPPSFGIGLDSLESCILSGNLLTHLPAGIANVSSLEMLHIDHNPLVALPDGFGENFPVLKELRMLELPHLSYIPESFGKMPLITNIDLSNTNISSLPTDPSAMVSLLSLKASNARLESLSIRWFGLPALHTLDVSHNRISVIATGAITEDVCVDGHSLATLDLSFNLLQESYNLASCMSKLPALNFAYLQNNAFESFFISGSSVFLIDMSHNKGLKSFQTDGANFLQFVDVSFTHLDYLSLDAPNIQVVDARNISLNGEPHFLSSVVPSLNTEKNTSYRTPGITCLKLDFAARGNSKAEILLSPESLNYKYCSCLSTEVDGSVTSMYWDSASKICRVCPEGVKCDSNTFVPVHRVQRGYYPFDEGKLCNSSTGPDLISECDVVQCYSPSWCDVQSGTKFECSSGHDVDSNMCSRCQESYFAWNQSCHKCPSGYNIIGTLLLVVTVFVLLPLLLLFKYRRVGNSFQLHCTYDILVSWAQITLLCFRASSQQATVSRSTPGLESNLIPPIESISFLQPFGLECFGSDIGFAGYFWITLASPIAVLVCLGVLRVVLKYIVNLRSSNVLIFSYVYLLHVLYISLASKSLQGLLCEDVGGVEVMRFAPYIACKSSEYKGIYAASVFSIVIFVAGIPLYFLFAMYQAHSNSEQSTSHTRLAVLFQGVKPSRWYWSFVILMRKLALSVLATTVQEHSVFMPFGIIFVLAGSLCSHLLLRPYTHTSDNVLEGFLLFLVLMTYFGTFISSIGALDSNHNLYSALLLLNLVVLLSLVLYLVYKSAPKLYSLLFGGSNGDEKKVSDLESSLLPTSHSEMGEVDGPIFSDDHE